MDVECPYCTMKSLEPIEGPTEVFFDPKLDRDELNMVNWRAYQCATCTRVTVLDESIFD